MKNKQWEYATVHKKHRITALNYMNDLLNFRGKEGWELVQVISKPTFFGRISRIFIFKRLKEESDTPVIKVGATPCECIDAREYLNNLDIYHHPRVDHIMAEFTNEYLKTLTNGNNKISNRNQSKKNA